MLPVAAAVPETAVPVRAAVDVEGVVGIAVVLFSVLDVDIYTVVESIAGVADRPDAIDDRVPAVLGQSSGWDSVADSERRCIVIGVEQQDRLRLKVVFGQGLRGIKLKLWLRDVVCPALSLVSCGDLPFDAEI
jgi:hypothetical protein